VSGTDGPATTAGGAGGARFASFAGGLGLVWVGVYVGLIISEGDNEVGVTILFAGLVGAASLACLAARGTSPRVRRGLLCAATVAFTSIGFLGILSIGMPLLIAAVLAAVAWSRAGG